MSVPKTKITHLLDTNNISYHLLPHSEPVFTVEAAARQRGVVKEEMVKSILLRDKDGRYVMACVTGDVRLDLLPPLELETCEASTDELPSLLHGLDLGKDSDGHTRGNVIAGAAEQPPEWQLDELTR